ncbi:OB-fold nucleic acid binding domain-containing protein [Methanobrevibacter olleyae]|uniref:Replication factor A n=1 Tax=Methanobrevibacter olleyae TaxID=294671 RepID=A0A126R218_METOL|nr:OB-fold nucleic acid binding domain-containing protein [Methanobrevibacter olleyae]AMK16112.1 replication factor A [Methanobrevibacter olleyae]SFL32795.1 replication factor A1 [Methanobrevibacter olleyae]
MDKEFFNGMNLAEDINEEDFQYIVEGWEKIQDLLSKDEFISKFNKVKEEYKDASFFSDKDFIDMVVNPFTGEKAEPISNFDNETPKTISEVEPGNNGFSIVARVMSISNPKIFTTRKGEAGKLANMQIADNTGEVRLVLWTENIKHLKHISEGDIVEITDIDCKDGFRGGKEFSLRPRSLLRTIDETSENYPKNIDAFPVYEENIISIEGIEPDEKVSIIGRLIRVPTPHSYESNGKKGKVTSLEIQDNTGKISYTLWNNDVKLVSSLDLKEGDIVKILNEQSRERNGEVSLSHWDGRILKVEGDFDIPEYEENIIKIGDAQEIKDVTLIGIVTKIQDTIQFNRQDGTKGFVKSIEITDDTGSIRVTLWGDDTKLKVSKGDILKIIGGNIEYDDYASSGYRVNTNWNSELKVNPEGSEDLAEELKDILDKLGPIPIGEIQDHEDDGEEVDIIGRLITINDSHSFQRDDGSTGVVRSGDIADSTGMVRISFWDEKAEASYGIGKAYQVENARTRLGMYAVELNAGKTTRVIELNDAESSDLPSFEELEETVYETKKIDDLDEDDMNIKVVARILEMEDTREFPRQDGTKGLVRNMTIGDESGFISVTLWDDKTNLPYDINEAIKIQNPRVNYNDRSNRLDLSIGNSTNILQPSYKELTNLPDIKELQDTLYTSKDIASLELEDRNVKIEGTFSNPYSERILIPKCPICNHTLDVDEEECSECGNIIDEPKYLLMLPGKLNDDTGEIQITFFNDLVEELIGMAHDDIVAQYEEEGDFGFLETKINDLEGRTLEVIADITYNNYDEEIRLRPKKILKNEL